MAFSEYSEYPSIPVDVALPVATTTVLPAGAGRKVTGGNIAMIAASVVTLQGITSGDVYFVAWGGVTGTNAVVPSFTSPSEGLEAVVTGAAANINLFLADTRPTD